LKTPQNIGPKKPFFGPIFWQRLLWVDRCALLWRQGKFQARRTESILTPGANKRRISRRVQDMKKTFALLAVATVVGALATTPASAQRALGAAIAGGLIGGAIVGGAVAASQAPPPVYVAPGPGPCRWVRERYWDGYDWRFRRVQYCD
jgi:hypothetical protein